MQRLYYLGKGTTEIDFEQIIMMHKRNIQQAQFDKWYDEIITEKPDLTINEIANIMCKKYKFKRFNPKYWVGINVSLDVRSTPYDVLTSDVDEYYFVYRYQAYHISVPNNIYTDTAETALVKLIENINGLPILALDDQGATISTEIEGIPHLIVHTSITDFTEDLMALTAQRINKQWPVKLYQGDYNRMGMSVSTGLEGGTTNIREMGLFNPLMGVYRDEPATVTLQWPGQKVQPEADFTNTVDTTEVYKGILTTGEYGEAWDILLLNGEPLTEQIEHLKDKLITVRYFYSDKPISSIEEAEVQLLKVIDGAADVKYVPHYSEITGYLWTDQDFNVGGHNLLEELESISNEDPVFFIMEVTIHTPVEGNEENDQSEN